MRRRDWALLALGAASGEPLSPVQLQKSLFLLGESLPWAIGPEFYQFRPYHYGPFDRAVYCDAEDLAEEGLVRLQREPARPWVEYAATTQGLRRAEALRTEAPAQAVAYLDAVVAWARRLSFQELVTSIYKLYPGQRVNSVFKA